jgi:DNA mismatch repair ATPase MutS
LLLRSPSSQFTRDSLEEGKRLYEMEAETAVSILAQAAEGGVTLCLFDELFRGTNSIDRVAASAAAYSSLLETQHAQGAPEPTDERQRRLTIVRTD